MLLSGTTLYVGGLFSSIGGQSRSRIAGIDISTGQVTDFNPDASSDVSTMLLSGTTLYVGGSFSSIGGTVIIIHFNIFIIFNIVV